MEERIASIILNISSLEDLAQFESDARQRHALTAEIETALRTRSAYLGRALISERTGLGLTNLSPAEEKIVQAVSEYVGIRKRQGKDADRTFMQLRNRGLRGAAEAAVCKSTPTRGFHALAGANLANSSYEQIIVDHPDEFSARALWYARRTLGLPNNNPRPPTKSTASRIR